MASLIALSITLIAGFAVFSYVNAQSGVAEQLLGTAFGSTVNYLAERFVIAYVNYSSDSKSVTLWLYNTGNIALMPTSVQIYNGTLFALYNATTVSISIGGTSCTYPSAALLESPQLYNPLSPSPQQASFPKGSLAKLTLTLPVCLIRSTPTQLKFSTGSAYTFSVMALYGNAAQYAQAR